MLKKIFNTIALIVVILTIVPLFAYDFWWIRMFDFPHVQLTLLSLIVILVYYIKFDYKSAKDLAI